MKKEALFATLSALLAGTLSAENLTRAQLDELLNEIAKNPAPKTSSYGAMCYAIMTPPERIEYECSVCNRKTIYALNKNWDLQSFVAWELDVFRKYVAKLNELGIDAKLDERSLCEKCRTKMSEKPTVGDMFLDVTVDGNIARNKVSDKDFPLLISFLEGKNKWESYGTETAMKESIPRICTLLGLTIDSIYNTGDSATPDESTKSEEEKIDDGDTKNPDAVVSHTVKSGETLSSIARQYNTTAEKIYDANKTVIGDNPDRVKVGMALTIPDGDDE